MSVEQIFLLNKPPVMTSQKKTCLITTPKTGFRLYASVNFRCIGAKLCCCGAKISSEEFVMLFPTTSPLNAEHRLKAYLN